MVCSILNVFKRNLGKISFKKLFQMLHFFEFRIFKCSGFYFIAILFICLFVLLLVHKFCRLYRLKKSFLWKRNGKRQNLFIFLISKFLHVYLLFSIYFLYFYFSGKGKSIKCAKLCENV